MREKVHFTEARGGGANMVDYPDFPKRSEHRITLKASGEKEISSDLIIRVGMNLFYGRITKADYSLGYMNGATVLTAGTISAKGSNYGVSGSFGITKKLNGSVDFEPFINGGLKRVKLSGSDAGMYYGDSVNFHLGQEKRDWFIGGGVSFKF